METLREKKVKYVEYRDMSFKSMLLFVTCGNNDNNGIIFGLYGFLAAFHQMLSDPSQVIADLANARSAMTCVGSLSIWCQAAKNP